MTVKILIGVPYGGQLAPGMPNVLDFDNEDQAFIAMLQLRSKNFDVMPLGWIPPYSMQTLQHSQDSEVIVNMLKRLADFEQVWEVIDGVAGWDWSDKSAPANTPPTPQDDWPAGGLDEEHPVDIPTGNVTINKKDNNT